jgi:hypothetical protein
MAGEILVIDDIGLGIYVIIFNLSSQIWNTATSAFESVTYNNWADYAIPVVDSTGTGVYIGDFPHGITVTGDYSVVAYEEQTPGTPAVGDFSIPGAREVMHWDGVAEIPVSTMGPSDVVTELFGSFIVNTTTFQKIMQGLAAVNLGNLTEATDHSTSEFNDVNDPNTVRAASTNTETTRSVTLN